jgi:hypothetical protein
VTLDYKIAGLFYGQHVERGRPEAAALPYVRRLGLAACFEAYPPPCKKPARAIVFTCPGRDPAVTFTFDACQDKKLRDCVRGCGAALPPPLMPDA